MSSFVLYREVSFTGVSFMGGSTVVVQLAQFLSTQRCCTITAQICFYANIILHL